MRSPSYGRIGVKGTIVKKTIMHLTEQFKRLVIDRRKMKTH